LASAIASAEPMPGERHSSVSISWSFSAIESTRGGADGGALGRAAYGGGA
jgi:hypothetical protein